MPLKFKDLEFLKAASEPSMRKQNVCKVQQIVNELPEEYKAVLQSQLDSNKFTNAGISRRVNLALEGESISANSIMKHRAKECSCQVSN